MRTCGVALAMLALGGCRPSTPEFAYVRTSSVVVTVTARAQSRVQVGEWLRLHASRATTGHWNKVRFVEIPEGAPWLGDVPAKYESEVAADLRWFVEPVDGVEFDSWAPRPVALMERAVRFSKPGNYRLWASSHPPLDATSNIIQVEVTTE